MELHFHHHYPQVEDRLRKMDRKLDLIMEAIVATKADIQADLEQMRQEAEETRGEANAAIAYIGTLLERVGQAAATSADLDEFRATFATIKTTHDETQAALKGAIQANPEPAPPA